MSNFLDLCKLIRDGKTEEHKWHKDHNERYKERRSFVDEASPFHFEIGVCLS